MISSLFSGKKSTDAVKASAPNATSSVESKPTINASQASREQLEASLKAPAAIPAQAIYQGDPDSQVIVFDGDETLWDDSDKHKIDEAKLKELGRTLETVAADDPANKLGREIKYVLRPGVEELFEYLKSRGHKIVVCTRNYEELAETLTEKNPILKKYVDGVLGRSDLTCEMNKNFTRDPKHPDNIGFGQKVLNFTYKYLWWYPTYPLKAMYSMLTGSHAPRLPAMKGEIGKYPPNMLEMLKAEGNKNFEGAKAPRILVDNKVEYETDDPADMSKFKYAENGIDYSNSARSDFAVISPNVVRNPGDKKATHFFAEFNEPKVKVKDANGQEKEAYIWVKNVIAGIERGWKEQYKLIHGKEPVLAEETKKQ